MKLNSLIPAKCLVAFATLATTLWMTPSAQAVSTSLVIAEAYGGGGNSGATYKNDFIVVFNLSGNNVDVQGWSVQYASSTGTSWQVTPLSATSKIIPPGGYFLVQEAAGSAGSVDLPTPDATGSINMSGTQFKVALCSSTTALTGSNPSGGSVVDLVGFGGANGFETAVGPLLSNTTSGQRANFGCQDTDNNSSDFATGSPNPRNLSSPTHSCVADVQPMISDISPSSVNTPAGSTVNFTVTLSQGSGQYYWSKILGMITNPIPTATTATLSLVNVTGNDTASYQVVVSNSVGTATSAVVTLSVMDPGIVTQPIGGTRLLNSTFTPLVVAGGAGLTYQWFVKPTSDNNFAGMSPLSNSGHILSADGAGLIVTNLIKADATNYFVVVNGTYGSATSSVVTLSIASSGQLAFWDFNGTIDTNNPVPAFGPGTAARANISGTFEPLSGTGIPDANDNANAMSEGLTNAAWGTSGYPSQGSSNKLGGVQFNVNTVGFKNITLAYDIRATASGSKYQRLQYTTNGTDFIDFPTTTTPVLQSSDASGFIPRFDADNDLTGFPGAANNPNFGIRIVAEWESSANGGYTGVDSYVGLNGVSTAYSVNGTVTFDRVAISATAITNANAAPTISGFTNAVTFANVTNLVVVDTDSTTNILFQVADAESSLANLNVSISPVTISGSPNFSYNPLTLINGVYQLSITPNNGGTGASAVKVVVTDQAGDTTVKWFYLTINPGNKPPTIGDLQHTNTLVNTAIDIPITLSDDHTLASATLSASSANADLVANENIQFSGSGANRIMTITPSAGKLGVAPITVTAHDNDPNGDKTSSVSFTLMVRPSTDIVVNDFFDYSDGNLLTVSYGLWQAHSATAGPQQVSSGHLAIVGSNNEDDNIPLIGAPYRTNDTKILYASMTVNFSDLPSVGGAYFAHFRDTNSSAATGFSARIWASTSNALSGYYRLGVANGAGATNTSGQFPMDLALNTDYTVVTRYIPSNGLSTIWINPTSEDGGVTATDVSPIPDTQNPIEVVGYAFRQNNVVAGVNDSYEGNLTIDNLKVGLNFDEVAGINVLKIHAEGTNAVISWTDPAFSLLSSTNVNGPYDYEPDVNNPAQSPYTVPATNSAKFFRLTNGVPVPPGS